MPEISIPAYGLYLLAAAVVVAIWGTSPAGQQASKDLAKGISKALEKSESDTDAPPTTTTITEDCPKKRECPDCPPPPPPPPPRVDRVPPSAPHFPCPGDHLHTMWYEVNQDPITCQCFNNFKEYVSCI
jgi:hypothetical protein